MNTFFLTISSPDGDIFKGEAVFLSLRGSEGDLAIMAGHTPFLTSVMSGECKIVFPDDSEQLAHLDGGLLTVSKDNVTLLSSGFKWKE